MQRQPQIVNAHHAYMLPLIHFNHTLAAANRTRTGEQQQQQKETWDAQCVVVRRASSRVNVLGSSAEEEDSAAIVGGNRIEPVPVEQHKQQPQQCLQNGRMVGSLTQENLKTALLVIERLTVSVDSELFSCCMCVYLSHNLARLLDPPPAAAPTPAAPAGSCLGLPIIA